MPVVREIRAVSETLLRVQFDSPIAGLAPYLDPDNYIFRGRLESIGVALVELDTVDVITTPQETDHFYELEVKSNA